jgi:hypothetical protein
MTLRRRLVRWLLASDFADEYKRGYGAAVDKILLLPEKVRLGNTLPLGDGAVIQDCSFVGGNPAVQFTPGTHIMGPPV